MLACLIKLLHQRKFFILRLNSASIILVHNHPSGNQVKGQRGC
ncbi:MAG: hypothetical protein LC122_07065 [Chitinophagales bacterium]|nr:hypothetical protein [Chitinophagales bacterium]